MEKRIDIIKLQKELCGVCEITRAWDYFYITAKNAFAKATAEKIVNKYGFTLGVWGYTLDGFCESWTAELL